MSSTTALHDVLALVRPELTRMNEQLATDLAPKAEELRPLLDHVARYRGKQLRPAMVYLAARLFGRVTEAHDTCAKVVELIHTATLVHDDILDGASVRRKEPTVNELHGNEVPVLLGDYIYALAFHMAVQLPDPVCAREFSEAVRVVCQGEITQCLHRGDRTWDRERYYRVIREKTASLYACACRVGAHYAGASEEAAAALAGFGEDLGMAFQIIDDCLDLTGEEAVVGKSLGTDVGLGKLTLPLLILAEQAGDRREEVLELATDCESPGGLRSLRGRFDVEAAVSAALAEAAQFVQRGLEALRTLPASPARDAMASLADYVLRRSY